MKEALKATLKEMLNYNNIGIYMMSGIGFAVLLLGQMPIPENSTNIFSALYSNKPILIGCIILGWFYPALIIRHKSLPLKVFSYHLPIIILIFVLMYTLSYVLYGKMPL